MKPLLDGKSRLAAVDPAFTTSTSSETTFLYAATQNRRADIVQRLVDSGVDVNERSGNGVAPIHVAAFNGDPDVMKALLSSPDIDVNLSIELK